MPNNTEVRVIEAGKAERDYWRDIWSYRELLAFLAWRDVLVRYKQTAIGVAWALIRPALTMIVFSIVFGRIARLPSGGVPYPLLVLAAMLPWYFFSTALAEGSGSLIQNANIISKVFFPRLIIPISAIAVTLVDFLISLILLAALMAWYGSVPSPRIFALPAFLLLAIGFTAGLAVWLSALNVRYRDFRYVVPFLIQVGLFLSPVGFSASVVPGAWRAIYALNPMVGIIEGFRWCLLDRYSLDFELPAIAAGMSLLILILGVSYFRMTERSMADVI